MRETWAGCEIPDDVVYDLEADVWVRVLGDRVRIGMTDVAQSRMGRLVQLSWKPVGKRVRRGRPLSALESAKWVGPMVSPITGVVVATNAGAFDRDIAIANRDPYGAGWLYELSVDEPRELEMLASPEVAVAHYRRVIDEAGLRCFRCEDPPTRLRDEEDEGSSWGA
jgi:glycine cleavage system H protein